MSAAHTPVRRLAVSLTLSAVVFAMVLLVLATMATASTPNRWHTVARQWWGHSWLGGNWSDVEVLMYDTSNQHLKLTFHAEKSPIECIWAESIEWKRATAVHKSHGIVHIPAHQSRTVHLWPATTHVIDVAAICLAPQFATIQVHVRGKVPVSVITTGH